MKILQTLVAISGLALSSASFAEPLLPPVPSVDVRFDDWIFNDSGYDSVRVTYPLLNGGSSAPARLSAGRFQGTASNIRGEDPRIFVDGVDDLFMYCYDIYEHVGGGWNVRYAINHQGPFARTLDFLGAVNYVLNGDSNTWADPYAWLHPQNKFQGAAIQLGIWESKYDSAGWNLGQGSSFTADDLDTDTNNFWAAIVSAVNNPSVADLAPQLAMTLEAPGAQDMITGDPPVTSNIPLPGTLALFGIGLAGLGLSRRKAAAG